MTAGDTVASRKLTEGIAAIPSGAYPTVQRGFAIVGRLSETTRAEILKTLITEIEQGVGTIDFTQMAESFSITQREVSSVISALSVTIGLLTDSKVSPEEFVVAAKNTIYNAADSEVALTVARLIVAKRHDLDKSIEERNLASIVLPSLVSFDIAVDLRFKFNQMKITQAVPVAILHLDTDGENQEIWLQLTKAELSSIWTKLGVTLKQMDVIDEISANALHERKL